MTVQFTVPGEPVGKGRPRFRRAGAYVSTYTPERTVSYENLVKLMYEDQCGGYMFPKEVPLGMAVVAYYTIPKSTSKKKRAEMLAEKLRPLKKPDSSNVLKAIEDALNKVAYYDDTQIVDTCVRRFYSDEPRVYVVIRDVSDGSLFEDNYHEDSERCNKGQNRQL